MVGQTILPNIQQLIDDKITSTSTELPLSLSHSPTRALSFYRSVSLPISLRSICIFTRQRCFTSVFVDHSLKLNLLSSLNVLYGDIVILQMFPHNVASWTGVTVDPDPIWKHL